MFGFTTVFVISTAVTRTDGTNECMKLPLYGNQLIVSLYNIYLVLGPLCKPLLVMELPNNRLLLLITHSLILFAPLSGA